jgi:transposase-like protein
MTEETVERVQLDPREPDDVQLMIEWLEGVPARLNQPWGSHGSVIAGVRGRLQEITAELQHIDHNAAEYFAYFKERDTEGWYVREIVTTARAVELAIEGGRPWEAVSRAMQIGELLTELRLKFSWEPDALWGRQRREEQRQGAEKWRRSSAEERIRMVNDLCAKGLSKRNAIRRTASHFGLHPSTVSKDYYNKKYRSTPVE